MIRSAHRAAKARVVAPAESLGPVFEVAFADIAGLDPCNARRGEPAALAIAELAADMALRGMLNPLIVRGAPGALFVLAGGRRFRALQGFAEPADLVRVRRFVGDDEAAARLSLAENIEREDLHPLEEADRVAELAIHAHNGEIARDLARTERWVRERLALSNLPEVARRAWLDDEIGLAQARALSFGAPSQIEALFANVQRPAILSDVRAIRAALAPKGVSANSPAARFVGLEAYVRAGGVVQEDFFDEQIWLLDGDLLRTLERRKLAAAADALCEAEGWGVQVFEPGDASRAVSAAYLDAEIDELRRIDAVISASGSDAEAHRLESRSEEIHRLGVLRKIPETDRARFGLYVGLDSDGRLDVTRGVIVDGGVAHSPPVDAAASVSPFPEAAVPSPRPRAKSVAQPPLVLHADARTLAQKAASRACADAIQQHQPRVVSRIALAAMLATDRAPLVIETSKGPGGTAGPLARRLARLSFAEGLLLLADATDAEVEQTFAETVASAVDLRTGVDDAPGRGLMDFLDGLQGVSRSMREATSARLDFCQFFEIAGRSIALAAIRECGGPAAESERAWMKDDQLAKEAALLARAKSWVPEFLRRTP